MKTNQKLILASSSPRRAELLKSAGIAFDVMHPTADETLHPDETPVEFTIRTAREKAESVKVGGIVLGADTAVVMEGRVLGKPSGPEEAISMLRLLSGKMHEVITAVCLRTAEKTECFHVATAVLFRDLPDEEIEQYVATGEPLDKAGAYAIQGGATGMVRRIDGSYSNVVGLPLCEVVEAMNGFDTVESQRSESPASEISC